MSTTRLQNDQEFQSLGGYSYKNDAPIFLGRAAPGELLGDQPVDEARNIGAAIECATGNLEGRQPAFYRTPKDPEDIVLLMRQAEHREGSLDGMAKNMAVRKIVITANTPGVRMVCLV